jgi:hypothetical protein
MMNKYYSADGKISIFTLTAENAADLKAMEVLDKNIGDGMGEEDGNWEGKKKNLLCTACHCINGIVKFASVSKVAGFNR